MPQWLPIDTAPKDGREIIGWGVFAADWGYTDERKGWMGMAWDGRRWQPTQPTSQYFNGFTPTHWIPLPPSQP